MDVYEKSLELHKTWAGKLDIASKAPITNNEELALAYTPGVAQPCRAIAKNFDEAYTYTIKQNTVAVVTDGSAVLGLGNIGAAAAAPVMEGKCALFKAFGGVNAFPICLDTQDTDEIIETVVRIAPIFGGINLEDISAPRCFEIEARLNDALGIPVFHDDQHGTAIVVLCGLINSLKVTGRAGADASAGDKREIACASADATSEASVAGREASAAPGCRVVINGAGSAGIAIAKLLLAYGFKHIVMCDSQGIVCSRSARLNDAKREMLKVTNLDDASGTLADAMRGADVFIGVSAPDCVSADMVRSMNDDPIIMALANPVPEITPDVAREAGARVVCTGRSDFPNQVNNVIAFPGIFKGALEARAERITEDMKMAAALALADLVSEEDLTRGIVMPEPFNPSAASAVARAVSDCWKRSQA